MKCNIEMKAREIAFVLRSEILKKQKIPFSRERNHKRHLKSKSKFFNNLICLPDIQLAKSAIKEDTIFDVTSGLKKHQNICN